MIDREVHAQIRRLAGTARAMLLAGWLGVLPALPTSVWASPIYPVKDGTLVDGGLYGPFDGFADNADWYFNNSSYEGAITLGTENPESSFEHRVVWEYNLQTVSLQPPVSATLTFTIRAAPIFPLPDVDVHVYAYPADLQESLSDYHASPAVYQGNVIVVPFEDPVVAVVYVSDVVNEALSTGSDKVAFRFQINPNTASDTSQAFIDAIDSDQTTKPFLTITEVECDDGNACTVDTYVGGSCEHQDNTPPDMCCDPVTGLLEVIDDGNACTDDYCDVDGTVVHTPSAFGTPCDDADECTEDDGCDGAGTCAGTSITTVSCETDDDCTLPGFCDTESGFCACAHAACCLDGGGCVNIYPVDCLDQAGEPLSLGSMCLGDIDGSGVDDACEPVCTASDPVGAEPGLFAKNRFISCVPGNAGERTALRVTLNDLPEPFAACSGAVRWVGEPFLVTEASGSAGGSPEPNFWMAWLRGEPHYEDWGAIDVLHVSGAAIVPGALYEIQVIHELCDTDEDNRYSAPYVVSTSAVWGDVVGNCGVTPCTPPNGIADFVDVAAMVDKFRNLPTAPVKARAELASDEPDLKIDFVDISHCVDAFRGNVYPFSGPGVCP